jgi:hypothetical protein
MIRYTAADDTELSQDATPETSENSQSADSLDDIDVNGTYAVRCNEPSLDGVAAVV